MEDDLFQSNKSWQLLAKGEKVQEIPPGGVVYSIMVDNMIKIYEIFQTNLSFSIYFVRNQ